MIDFTHNVYFRLYFCNTAGLSSIIGNTSILSNHILQKSEINVQKPLLLMPLQAIRNLPTPGSPTDVETRFDNVCFDVAAV